MRKTVVAVTVGLLLVAGEATALNTQTAARVGDRVGARADAASGFTAMPPQFRVSAPRMNSQAYLALAATIIGAAVVANQDGGDS